MVLGFEALNLKSCELKLWKPTAFGLFSLSQAAALHRYIIHIIYNMFIIALYLYYKEFEQMENNISFLSGPPPQYYPGPATVNFG